MTSIDAVVLRIPNYLSNQIAGGCTIAMAEVIAAIATIRKKAAPTIVAVVG